MRKLLIAFAVLGTATVPRQPAGAQSSRDSLAVLSVAARFIKPSLSGRVMLESREVSNPHTDAAGKPERVTARTLAAILGVPLAHREDVVECRGSCKGPEADQVVILGTPVIKGDSARVVISQVMRPPSKHARYLRSHYLRLVRQGSTWRVVRSTVGVT